MLDDELYMGSSTTVRQLLLSCLLHLATQEGSGGDMLLASSPQLATEVKIYWE